MLIFHLEVTSYAIQGLLLVCGSKITPGLTQNNTCGTRLKTRSEMCKISTLYTILSCSICFILNYAILTHFLFGMPPVFNSHIVIIHMTTHSTSGIAYLIVWRSYIVVKMIIFLSLCSGVTFGSAQGTIMLCQVGLLSVMTECANLYLVFLKCGLS